ncbi:hypothetical protein DB30_03226 [Enhygromyxa salina]|uniref:DUF3421 domain-containing protein n=1 Tax=Enhygromyxa salina TaxID=215803 RepID=A0A0C2D7A1_9BACT|nr:DUF3421 domain-containing protein [Enhygromyxa salina]KIG17525.1 hypothetical protein DB30_03226 [Enhygromyxa salina]
MSWKNANDGRIPDGATKVGYESNGEPLYLARAEYDGGVHIGKVRLAFGGANIPYGGKEVKVTKYEVFCGRARWMTATQGQIPDDAIKYGQEANGEPLFAARAKHANGLHPGKVRLAFGAANIPYGGKELKETTYEVLVER